MRGSATGSLADSVFFKASMAGVLLALVVLIIVLASGTRGVSHRKVAYEALSASYNRMEALADVTDTKALLLACNNPDGGVSCIVQAEGPVLAGRDFYVYMEYKDEKRDFLFLRLPVVRATARVVTRPHIAWFHIQSWDN